jgi:hypothetical protein
MFFITVLCDDFLKWPPKSRNRMTVPLQRTHHRNIFLFWCGFIKICCCGTRLQCLFQCLPESRNRVTVLILRSHNRDMFLFFCGFRKDKVLQLAAVLCVMVCPPDTRPFPTLHCRELQDLVTRLGEMK